MAYLGTGVNGMSFTYWSWNPNSGDTGGIALDDWTTINTAKQAILQPYLIAPTGGGGPTSGPTAGPTAPTSGPTTPPPGGCDATYRSVNTWQGGFQGELTVTNTGGGTLNPWRATWTLARGHDAGQRLERHRHAGRHHRHRGRAGLGAVAGAGRVGHDRLHRERPGRRAGRGNAQRSKLLGQCAAQAVADGRPAPAAHRPWACRAHPGGTGGPPGLVGVAGPGAPVRQRGAVGVQVVRRRVGDHGVHDVAGPRPLGRRVAKCTSRPSRARPDIRPVRSSLRPSPTATSTSTVRADQRPVLRPGDLLDDGHQPLVALLHDLLGHLAVHRGRRGAGALRVLERERAWRTGPRRTTSRVRSKSASVSPGKPTMMSVVIAASGIAARTLSMMPR